MAPLVYAKSGRLEDLPRKKIAGAWVAIDANYPGRAWETIGALGARGVIFLGNSHTNYTDLRNKTVHIPLKFPRLYVDNPAAVAEIQAGKISELAIAIHAKWVSRVGENVLCFIPGAYQGPARGGRWVRRLDVVLARYDASSEVLGQCPGADQDISAAAVVNLARRLAAKHTHSAVLFALVADNAWNFRGTRELLRLLQARPRAVDKMVRKLAVSSGHADVIVAALRAISAGKFSSFTDRKIRGVIRGALTQEMSDDQRTLENLRTQPRTPQRQMALKRYLARKIAVGAARHRVRGRKPLGRFAGIVRRAARRLASPWRRELRRRRRKLAMLQQWKTIRAGLKLNGKMPHIRIVMGVHLTSHGRSFGFFSESYSVPGGINFSGEMQQYADVFSQRYFYAARRVARKKHLPFTSTFDVHSTSNNSTLATFFPIPQGLSTDDALWRGVAAGSFATIRDVSGVVDCPNDTANRINWRNIAGQMRDLRWLLLGSTRRGTTGALVDAAFRGRVQTNDDAAAQTVTLLKHSFGQTVSTLKAGHYLIGLQYQRASPPIEGTHRLDWRFTHVDGRTTFHSVIELNDGQDEFYLQAFRFNKYDRPVAALVHPPEGSASSVIRGFYNPDASRPARAMVFSARELDLMDLFDPRYLQYLNSVQILNFNRQGAARYANVYYSHGLASAFVRPALRWQALVSKGLIANRMILINADAAHPLGTGFTSKRRAALGPPIWRADRDLRAIDDSRRATLAKFGIKSNLIDRLNIRAARIMRQAAAAKKKRDYLDWMAGANAAWSLQAQVYHHLISTADSIVYGVIFLLLGVIPFSYFLERLVLGSPNVYRQMTGFGVIFLIMTGVLASFHPAFRITSAPLMILLAFLILILSVVVIYILWGKFEEEIARLRGATSGSHSVNVKRGAVLGAALRLGLSNMRRRGARTTLTLLTLVLLTFTLLCFTSVRQSMHLRPYRLSRAPRHPPEGIMIRRIGWRQLPTAAIAMARQAAGRHGAIACRYWFSSSSPRSLLNLPIRPVHASAKAPGALLNALLGLQSTEALFQRPPGGQMAAWLPGWQRLAAGQMVCFLPNSLENQPFHVNQLVRVDGQRLRIAGFFNDHHIPLRALDGAPLFPVDSTANAAVAQPTGGQHRTNQTREPVLQYLKPWQVAIVPERVARRLGGNLASIMVLPNAHKTPAEVTAAAINLARRSAFSVVASNGRHSRLYDASPGSSLDNLSTVIVPMAIAAVIVLNTMLGAVSEREREIHVYTSLGLAPGHVGALFLAEAAALGTLGVVFGYIFGQGIATFLSHTHLLPGVSLNYSSLGAIATMGLVLGLVMASALWPARTASRVAAPSLQREWKLPAPDGDILQVDLPFTVNATAARGVCAFLDEYFTSTTQAGSGRFTADQIESFQNAGTLQTNNGGETIGGDIRGLSCRVWLAPYDLGVIQHFWLAIYPTAQKNVFEVRLTLKREAGNPATWLRLNRPFLVEVRKQFLLWRAVSPELVNQYVVRSEGMFAAAKALPPPEAA